MNMEGNQMKKISNNDKKIAVACLLQLISLVVLCVREGVSSDGLEIIILLAVIAGFSTGVNIFNYKILELFNFKYYGMLLKIPSCIFAFLMVFAMIAWLLNKNGDAQFIVLQTASAGAYIGLCITRKYCAKKERRC